MYATQRNVTTTPHLPENILASGYSGLKLTTRYIDQNFVECSWRFQSQSVAFVNFVSCFNVTQSGLQTTCMRDNNVTTTSLVVSYPLNTTTNSVEFLLQCRTASDRIETIASINVSIQGNVFPDFLFRSSYGLIAFPCSCLANAINDNSQTCVVETSG